MINLVNQRRAAGATCGGTAYPPVGPVSLDTNLRAAARGHSEDMAVNAFFSHTGSDGSSATNRIWAAGYSGGYPLGENIAGGQSSPTNVVNAWMASTGHCQNIMNGSFEDLGVGYAYLDSSPYRHYWTQNFGGG